MNRTMPLMMMCFCLLGCGLAEQGTKPITGSDAALQDFAGKTAADVPALINQLTQRDAFGRQQAIHSLATLKAEATPAVPALIVCLTDVVAETRLAAVHALGCIGPGASPAVPTLERLLNSESSSGQVLVREALTRIQQP
jgi:HEAT repeat protein